MTLVRIESGDSNLRARDVGAIHKEAYGNDHFTSAFRLGKLGEYYGCLIRNSDATLMAFIDGEPAGFLVAGSNVHVGVTEFIGANRIYLVSVLATHPRFCLEKVAARLTARSRADEGTASYRLLSIATRPRFQNMRVGEALIEALESILLAEGTVNYGLSVRKDNLGAIRFYRRMGFVLERETHASTYFRKSLFLASPASAATLRESVPAVNLRRQQVDQGKRSPLYDRGDSPDDQGQVAFD